MQSDEPNETNFTILKDELFNYHINQNYTLMPRKNDAHTNMLLDKMGSVKLSPVKRVEKSVTGAVADQKGYIAFKEED